MSEENKALAKNNLSGPIFQNFMFDAVLLGRQAIVKCFSLIKSDGEPAGHLAQVKLDMVEGEINNSFYFKNYENRSECERAIADFLIKECKCPVSLLNEMKIDNSKSLSTTGGNE